MVSLWRSMPFRRNGLFSTLFLILAVSALMFIWFNDSIFDELAEENIVVDPDMIHSCNITKSKSKKSFWSPPSIAGYAGKVYTDIVITFEDPKAYVGPVIKGWEPNKDRNSSIYVRPFQNTIKLDPMTCRVSLSDRIEMMILQHSAPKNFEARMANRQTWMKFADSIPEIRVIFVIGVPTISIEDLDHVDLTVQQQIEEEFQQFGDILQVDSFESYSNNTLKSLHSIKYLLGLNWKRLSKSGKPPKFVMRTDDDVYVNLPLVNKRIIKNRNWEAIDEKSNWPPLIGDMLDQSPVVKIPENLMGEKYAPKTFYECPSYFHNGIGLYPSYMQGAGYFMPWWALSCIYQQSLQLPYFFIEDVFIGGWVADRCSVPKHHETGFTMFRPNKPVNSFDKDFDILVHYVDKNYKIRLHRVLTKAYKGLISS